MVKKVILNFKNNRYHRYKNNDINFAAINAFLIDDIGCLESSFVFVENWLKDPEQIEASFNLTSIEKEDNLILLSSDLFGHFMEIKRENFVKILKQWKNICLKKPKEVIIKQNDDGTIFLEGNNNIIPDALIKFYDNKYRYGGSNNRKLKNLALFLVDEFQAGGLSHDLIINTWLDDQQETTFTHEHLLIEKQNDKVMISYDHENREEKHSFTSTKNQLRKIYRDFQETKMLEPKVIRVYHDGNEVKVEGLAAEI